MKTKHSLFFFPSQKMTPVPSHSVDLIVTSPPYPMIEMWDLVYGKQNPQIKKALSQNKGKTAFDLMHRELEGTWRECHRVLKDGGFACINIGDATRTVGKVFQLYSNHSKIIQSFTSMGFHTLPLILWHKKTNSPTKFMGSGMLPSGAYVTLEHEYILVFRKGPKRIFKTNKEKQLRGTSAFFWEERNKWFSDIWRDLAGAPQTIKQDKLRKRSGAFPFELAHRLIGMYSVQSDTVLDPFAGTGTTALAALTMGRNSISMEMDKSFRPYIIKRLTQSTHPLNNKITQRLLDHIQFVKNHNLNKKPMKYQNLYYHFPVMTKQERSIQLPYIKSLKLTGHNGIVAQHGFSSPTHKPLNIKNKISVPDLHP